MSVSSETIPTKAGDTGDLSVTSNGELVSVSEASEAIQADSPLTAVTKQSASIADTVVTQGSPRLEVADQLTVETSSDKTGEPSLEANEIIEVLSLKAAEAALESMLAKDASMPAESLLQDTSASEVSEEAILPASPNTAVKEGSEDEGKEPLVDPSQEDTKEAVASTVPISVQAPKAVSPQDTILSEGITGTQDVKVTDGQVAEAFGLKFDDATAIAETIPTATADIGTVVQETGAREPEAALIPSKESISVTEANVSEVEVPAIKEDEELSQVGVEVDAVKPVVVNGLVDLHSQDEDDLSSNQADGLSLHESVFIGKDEQDTDLAIEAEMTFAAPSTPTVPTAKLQPAEEKADSGLLVESARAPELIEATTVETSTTAEKEFVTLEDETKPASGPAREVVTDTIASTTEPESPKVIAPELLLSVDVAAAVDAVSTTEEVSLETSDAVEETLSEDVTTSVIDSTTESKSEEKLVEEVESASEEPTPVEDVQSEGVAVEERILKETAETFVLEEVVSEDAVVEEPQPRLVDFAEETKVEEDAILSTNQPVEAVAEAKGGAQSPPTVAQAESEGVSEVLEKELVDIEVESAPVVEAEVTTERKEVKPDDTETVQIVAEIDDKVKEEVSLPEVQREAERAPLTNLEVAHALEEVEVEVEESRKVVEDVVEERQVEVLSVEAEAAVAEAVVVDAEVEATPQMEEEKAEDGVAAQVVVEVLSEAASGETVEAEAPSAEVVEGKEHVEVEASTLAAEVEEPVPEVVQATNETDKEVVTPEGYVNPIKQLVPAVIPRPEEDVPEQAAEVADAQVVQEEVVDESEAIATVGVKTVKEKLTLEAVKSTYLPEAIQPSHSTSSTIMSEDSIIEPVTPSVAAEELDAVEVAGDGRFGSFDFEYKAPISPTALEIEHHKASWTPSYTTTTINNVPEDEAVIEDELPEKATLSLLITDDDGHVESVDEEPSATPSPRPWTPSYSVHSQGSPMQSPTVLDNEVPEAPLFAQKEAEEAFIEATLVDVAVAKPLDLELPEEAIAEEATSRDIGAVTEDSPATQEPEAVGIEVAELFVPSIVGFDLDVAEPIVDAEAPVGELGAVPNDETEGSEAHNVVVKDSEPTPEANEDHQDDIVTSTSGVPETGAPAEADAEVVEGESEISAIEPEVAVVGEVTEIQKDESTGIPTLKEPESLKDLETVPLAAPVPVAGSPSSWIPSYSVSRQGSPLPKSQELEDETYVLETTAVDTVALESNANAVEEVAEEVAEETSDKTKVPLAPETEEKHVVRSLTPASYSVTTQGVVHTEVSSMQDVEHAEVPEPIVETVLPASTESNEVDDKLTGAVEELEALQAPPALAALSPEKSRAVDEEIGIATCSPDDVDDAQSPSSISPFDSGTSTSRRSKIESIASSRFFPGAWFGSSHKVSDENRTSLETASGQFIPAKDLSSPIATNSTLPPITTTNLAVPAHEMKEHTASRKRRWCTIM